MVTYPSWVSCTASAGDQFKKPLRVETESLRSPGKGTHLVIFLPCLICNSVLTAPTAFCTPLCFSLYVASLFVNILCDLLECKLMAAGISVPLCLAHRGLSNICCMKEQMVACSWYPWDVDGKQAHLRLFLLVELWKELQAFLEQEEWRAMIFFFSTYLLGAVVFFLN